jgi:hypothetical protein
VSDSAVQAVQNPEQPNQGPASAVGSQQGGQVGRALDVEQGHSCGEGCAYGQGFQLLRGPQQRLSWRRATDSCLFLNALLAALAKELPVGVALGEVVMGGTGRGADLLQGAW